MTPPRLATLSRPVAVVVSRRLAIESGYQARPPSPANESGARHGAHRDLILGSLRPHPRARDSFTHGYNH